MSAIAVAIVCAFAFGFNNIAERRAVIRVRDAAIGIMLSVPISVIFFMLAIIVIGQVGSIASFSWQNYGWLSAAGVIHFVVGRSLNYKVIQLVGANVSNVVRRTNALVSVILAITVLGEPLSWRLAAGVLLIVCGVVVTGLNPQMFRSGQKLFSGVPRKAYLLGIGFALATGVSPILIKLGLGDSGSPLAGVFISFSAATIFLIPFLWNSNTRTTMMGMSGGAAGYFCLSGLIASVANLLRYTALSLGPASVVVPIIATSPVFVLLLSFIFNRKIEVFGMNIIIGMITVVAGGILLV